MISLFRRSFPGRDIGDKKEERSQDRSLFVVEVVLREEPELPSCNRVKHGGREGSVSKSVSVQAPSDSSDMQI